MQNIGLPVCQIVSILQLPFVSKDREGSGTSQQRFGNIFDFNLLVQGPVLLKRSGLGKLLAFPYFLGIVKAELLEFD